MPLDGARQLLRERPAAQFDASHVEAIMHAPDVPLELTPAIGIRRRNIVGGKMAVEGREYAK
jgi:hypothetical protein